jgi:asparagine synthase (glutamine-hydrolysing)
MKELNSSSLEPNSIVDILTLRYDPIQKPLLQKLTPKDFEPTNLEPSVEYIEKSIRDSIQEKFRAGIKRISIALSGGVDSALMLASFHSLFPDTRIHAISIRFANSIDETAVAAKIAEKFNVDHHIVEIENYLSELPKAISIIGMPFWDLHWYHVIKKAKEFSDGILSGDGGDEIFGGYTFRYKKFLSLTTLNSSPLEKVKAYLHCHERDWVPDQDKLFGDKAKFSWDFIYGQLLPYFDNSLSPLYQVFLADYHGKLLYNFSPINTMIQNHFGITSITPLLSTELISYATHIPNNLKYDAERNVGKIMLRKILGKYEIDSLISLEKYGFNVNTLNLWKSYGQKLCEYYLSDSRVVREGWIRPDWIKRYINKDDLDVRYINKLLGLLAFEIWYRLFVTKEMQSDVKL